MQRSYDNIIGDGVSGSRRYFSTSKSSGRQVSVPVAIEVAGAANRAESAALAKALGASAQGGAPATVGAGPGVGRVGAAPTSIQQGARSESEQNLINDVINAVSGNSAVRGLGRPTGSAVAQVAAPVLSEIRQAELDRAVATRGQDIGQRGQDLSQITEARGQDVTQRGQDVSRSAADQQALVNLIELVLPQVVGGQVSTGKTSGSGFGITL